MSNEELVEAIRQGETELMPQLWEQVQRLCWRIAGRYKSLAEANNAVDVEDLIQASYLAMCRAVEAYKSNNGAFNTLLGFYVRNECQEALGLRGRKREEHYITLSLDQPISSENSENIIASTVPDDSIPGLAERLEYDDLRREVQAAVGSLPSNERQIIESFHFQQLPMTVIAQSQGMSVGRVSAARTRAYSKLQRTLKDYDCYHHKGVRAFFSTQTSTVEDAVLWRERYGL